MKTTSNTLIVMEITATTANTPNRAPKAAAIPLLLSSHDSLLRAGVELAVTKIQFNNHTVVKSFINYYCFIEISEQLYIIIIM